MNPDDIGNLPPELLEEIVEEELEKIEEDIEEFVQEKETLGKPTLPKDYDPGFTRRVLELDIKNRIDVAAALARAHGAEDKFYSILGENDVDLRVPNLARIVDEAVLAQPVEKKPTFWEQARAWYNRRGHRLKYNAEMIFGSVLEYPGTAIGGLVGSAVFSNMESPQWVKGIQDFLVNENIAYVSNWAEGLDFSDSAITLTSMIAVGAS